MALPISSGISRFIRQPKPALTAAVLMLAAATSLEARALELSSQRQGWRISLDTPALVPVELVSAQQGYRYYGKTADGLHVSLHVEPLESPAVTHSDCREHYWKTAAPRLPQIDTASLNIQSGSRFEQVSYNYRLSHKGRTWDMPNTHLYFAINGLCADLHLGASPNYPGFQQLSNGIAASLQFETAPLLLQASNP